MISSQGKTSNIRSSFFVIGLLFFVTACADRVVPPPAIPEHPQSIKPETVSFTLPKPERWALENGLEVFYLFDDELPMISGQLYLPGGKLYDPADLPGLFEATGSQMREGSIKGLAPDAFDKTLDDLAASIEAGYGAEYGNVGFSCLAEDFEQVFSMMAKVVREPAFDEARLQIWKKHVGEGIRRRRDNPETMAFMAFGELVYGKGSPYSKAITTEVVKKINTKLLREMHQRFVRPNGSRLVISGAVPRNVVEQAIKKNFGTWLARQEPIPELPKISNQIKPGLYVLERDFDQATVIMGHLGPPRLTPDTYQIALYNRVLGHGGFSSKLVTEIRSRLGLAYDVTGGIYPGPGAGTFSVTLGTRVSEVTKAIKKSLEVVAETLVQKPEEESFSDAKSGVENSFIFRFQSPGAIAQRAAQLEILGFPKDYDDKYLANIGAVKSEQLPEVGQRWIKPNEMVVVIVGKVSAEEIKRAFQSEKINAVYKLDFDTEPKVVGKIE